MHGAGRGVEKSLCIYRQIEKTKLNNKQCVDEKNSIRSLSERVGEFGLDGRFTYGYNEDLKV